MDFDLFYSGNEYAVICCTRKICTEKLFKLFLLYFLVNNIYKINSFYHSTNLFQSIETYTYTLLRDSVAAAVVVVVVVRTRPRAIPLAMITMKKSTHGFPFLSHDNYGAPLGGPSGRRSSAINYKVNAS